MEESRDLAVAITMAGLGSRFREAGYDVPKYMIEARGRTLFEWSMDSLADYWPHASRAVFVVREEDGARGWVLDRCAEMGIPGPEVLELAAPTDGQATTALLACEGCDPDEGLLVYNIDTYVEPGAMRHADLRGDGHMPCFHAPGDHWSFARIDESGRVVEVREKRRVSDNCTLGAYWFRSVALYREVYAEYYADASHLEKGERYIAPLYNHMIARGDEVTISIVDAARVHVLGTPAELEEFVALGELGGEIDDCSKR